jgi:hypothetical protein
MYFFTDRPPWREWRPSSTGDNLPDSRTCAVGHAAVLIRALDLPAAHVCLYYEKNGHFLADYRVRMAFAGVTFGVTDNGRLFLADREFVSVSVGMYFIRKAIDTAQWDIILQGESEGGDCD